MVDSNKKTIDSYENKINEYIEGTPKEVTGSLKLWIDKTLSTISKNAKIIEIGYIL